MRMAKIWFKETRADFLVLSVVLTAIGGAVAAYEGFFSWPRFLLTVFGVVCAHAAVNLFNEYSDWRTGIDSATVRTPFSGGSGMMQAGLADPAHVRLAAWSALALSGAAGTVLTFLSGPLVPVLMLVGGITAVTYTDYLARWGVGEVASGLSLGTLVVIGAAYVQTVEVTVTAVWAGIPAGLLTMQLLFLNEFPDSEADARGGRRHLVILLGKRRAAILYAVVMAAVYAVIIAGAAIGILPPTVLVSLAAMPLAAGAAVRAFRYPDHLPGLVPGLAMNVIAVLATDALLAAGLAAG